MSRFYLTLFFHIAEKLKLHQPYQMTATSISDLKNEMKKNSMMQCNMDGDVCCISSTGVLFTLKGHAGHANCKCPEQRVGNLITYRSRHQNCNCNGHCAAVTHIYIIPDEVVIYILTTGNDGSVLLWTLKILDGNIVSEFKVLMTTTIQHPDFVGVGMIKEGCGYLFAVNAHGSLLLWDRSGKRIDYKGQCSPLSRWNSAPPRYYAKNKVALEITFAEGLSDGQLYVRANDESGPKELYFLVKKDPNEEENVQIELSSVICMPWHKN